MKEIKTIIEKYDQLKSSGSKMALATVINVELSSYRRSGARMLIIEGGSWVGGISGGCLEGDTLKKAQYSIFKNKSTTVSYDTRDGDPNQIGIGLGCNGLIDVLITPIDIEDVENPIELLRKCTSSRDEHIIIHIVKSQENDQLNGTSFHYDPDTANILNLPPRKNAQLTEATNSVIQSKKSKLIEITNHLIFIEFLPPTIRLYIYGRNYDIMPLLSIADVIGWETHVVTDLSKINAEIIKLSHHTISAKNDQIEIDDYSAVLLMSHDYETDQNNLIKLMDYPISYIGILGPKKRYEKIKDHIRSIRKDYNFSHIYGPMGLDTGASTPEEIAIAIISEIRTVFSSRDGGLLRDRTTSIYNT